MQENNFASDTLRLDKICLYWRVGCAPSVRFKMLYLPSFNYKRDYYYFTLTFLFNIFILCILTCIRTCCSNCVYLFPSAPPSYAEVVTEWTKDGTILHQGVLVMTLRALQGPLFAYIQEFLFPCLHPFIQR